MSIQSQARSEALDTLKGLLILLVVAGHVVIGSLWDNLPRYVIYSFHMPLFLAVGGYLISRKTLNEPSVGALFGRYWQRLLLPWLLAFAFYMVPLVASNKGGGSRLKVVLTNILYPWFHLWYVPAFFLMVVALYLIRKATRSDAALGRGLMAAFLTSAVLLVAWLSTIGRETVAGDLTLPFPWLGDKRLYVYFAFFALGALQRYRPIGLSFPLSLAGTLIFAGVWLANYFLTLPAIVAAIGFLGLNAFLILTVLDRIKAGRFFESPLLAKIGVLTLPIYLWHVAPLVLLHHYHVDAKSQIAYYGLSIVSVMALIAAVSWLSRGRLPWMAMIAGVPVAEPEREFASREAGKPLTSKAAV
jgi:fucose 4-O-acetylase-like acetyltransferase